MAFLSEDEIKYLTNPRFSDQTVTVKRGQSESAFTMIKSHRHGKKGVVWEGRDDIGADVAIKLIPKREYENYSMMDEMFHAQKLSSRYFAEVVFFGDVISLAGNKTDTLSCVVAKWINGIPFEEYIVNHLYSVDQFLKIAESIFQALANLKKYNLCHDDLHSGNLLMEKTFDYLADEETFALKIIDTGTIKRVETRDKLLNKLRLDVELLRESKGDADKIKELSDRLAWKEPDDHLRAIECLIEASNALINNYHKLDFWERRFIDSLLSFFEKATDQDFESRLYSPDRAMSALESLAQTSKQQDQPEEKYLRTPFDYPSSEMIRDDKEFATLFSEECPWLTQCKDIRPLYIYGPRGSGKSSVLRWLSFKTYLAGGEKKFSELSEIGIYISCSVELRSRFWLLSDDAIDEMGANIIRFFNFLLLEELCDTLSKMSQIQKDQTFNFGFTNDKLTQFSKWFLTRIDSEDEHIRLEGQSHFEYLRIAIRKLKWETWSNIQNGKAVMTHSDPALISDVCREIADSFEYFNTRMITFLLDDYSNQRIPIALQKKLNSTISFAKQALPIFKVTSEYNGVDLEGIDRSREVTEINIGEKYTSLEENDTIFLQNIFNKRFENSKPKYVGKLIDILGNTIYDPYEMANAIANEKKEGSAKFFYYGIDCIHWICSGDIALALELIKKIYDRGTIRPESRMEVSASIQHKTIQDFSHEEVKRLRYIVPFGDRIFEIVCQLGILSNTICKVKTTQRVDRPAGAVCKTHLDIKHDAIIELDASHKDLSKIFAVMNAKAILFSLEESRTRKIGQTIRYQIRRIYLPAFKAPLKRDEPIKIDTTAELVSLLSDPNSFCRREIKRTGINELEFDKSIDESILNATKT
jgi:hypothetical protein